MLFGRGKEVRQDRGGFGSEIAKNISNTNGCTSSGKWEGADDVRGLLPQILDNLVSLHEMKCQISIVEVVDD